MLNENTITERFIKNKTNNLFIYLVIEITKLIR
jgi:hypothetical protein